MRMRIALSVRCTLYMGHEMSLEPCGRCYSVPIALRMRSDTNTPHLLLNTFLLRIHDENYLQHYENYLQVH